MTDQNASASGASRPNASQTPLSPPPRERWLLASLLLGNFVVGTGVLLPAGMLTELASGLSVSLPVAGRLMLVSGLVVAVGAPLIAGLTSAADRRRILLFAMLVHAAAHIGSALAPNFEWLVVSRLALAVAAAIFTPQAAATVSLLLPPERRSSAITMIFIGWSLATVGGMPLGGYVAHALGWRTAFSAVAVLSFAAAAALWLTVPKRVRIPRLSASSWVSVATSPALLLVLAVTILNGTGQFTFFTYLTPSLKSSLNASAAMLTFVLAWYGASATAGNIIASRFVSRIGPARSAFVTLLAMALGLALWGAGADTLAVVLIAASLWGLGTFATNSIQQARLAALAPDLTSASIALNTSAIYLGQALGSALGGQFLLAGWMAHLPWAGAAILVSAAGVSVFAERYERRQH